MRYEEGNWCGKLIKAHAEGVRHMRGSLDYLEIGVRYATTYNMVLPHATDAIGVDIEVATEAFMEGGTFYHGSSDEFFDDCVFGPFDLIFIDGLHQYEQVKKDFYNSLSFLTEEGTIYLHDTWPVLKENESACGNVWKFADEVDRDYFDFHTFRAFPGLTSVQRRIPRTLD